MFWSYVHQESILVCHSGFKEVVTVDDEQTRKQESCVQMIEVVDQYL